jgi:tetratricopeptide (TPR) repeat protein
MFPSRHRDSAEYDCANVAFTPKQTFKSVQHWIQRSAFDKAAAEMALLPTEDQTCVEGLHIWAFISHKLRDWQKLENYGRELQKRDPSDLGGTFSVAESLHQRRRSQEAIQEIQTAKSLFRNEAEFFYTLGRFQCGAGMHEAAIKSLEAAYQTQPVVKEKALLSREFEPIWLQLVDIQ